MNTRVTAFLLKMLAIFMSDRTTALTGPRQVKFSFQSRPILGYVSNALFVVS
ncbi:MAG TPA: hypothetical protein PKD54_06050 [Pirellulaceae bacterium]|nr:hypothetical protein [Pirellulaceae bacterium]